jgi:hypothetical protein
MAMAATPSGWAPTLAKGEVWFCGCGRPWGSEGPTWLALDGVRVTHLDPESELS